MRARVERLGQVFRVLDYRRHQQPDITVWRRGQTVEVLGDRRIFAVGDAVLAQVSRPEARRHHFQRPAAGDRPGQRRTATQAAAAAARYGWTERRRRGAGATSTLRALPVSDRES